MKIANAPQTDDSRAAHDQSKPRVLRPLGVLQEVAIGTELDPLPRPLRLRVHPFLWFLELANDEYAEKCRNRTDEEHRLPGTQSKRKQMTRREGTDSHANQT